MDNAMRDLEPPSDSAQLCPNGHEPRLLGKVASPEGAEATSEEFTFWVAEDVLVEKSQIVHAVSAYGHGDPGDRGSHGGQGNQDNHGDRSDRGDSGTITFHAVVDEVYRRSRRRTVLEEADRFGGDARATLPLDSQGLTYAAAKILRAEPPVLAPPREESLVFLSGAREARLAYAVEEMGQPLPIGLLQNGGSAFAGPAYLDLDYLLGANGAHLNVTGVAGAATKSSFLTCVLYRLLQHCIEHERAHPSAPDRLAIVPIVLNVKGYDLLWLDHANRRYVAQTEDAIWHDIGITSPTPFAGARFLAPEQAAVRAAVPVGRAVERYSWSLGDVVDGGLFPYLFGDEDREDENFLGLLQDVEAVLTVERQSNGTYERALGKNAPPTFQALLDWIGEQMASKEEERRLRNHHPGTWRKFYRRLRRVVQEGEGLLVRHGTEGRPLDVTATATCPPVVVDLQSVRDAALQRFVVAAIFAQVSAARTGTNAVPNLAYVIVLDELNRWAPRGASDPITRLIERVVAEMRSQGVILIGAQQQASQVSPRVIENSAIRALGRTGALELNQPLWSFLGGGAKRRIQNLRPDEKLVYQVNFREPMQVRMPFPCWAMRRDEAAVTARAGRFDELEEWER